MVSPSQAAQARRKAESRMTDDCRIVTRTVQPLNETTGVRPPPLETVTYEGVCVLKGVNTAARQVDAAGQQLVLDEASIGLPVDTSGAVATNQVIVMTGSLHDPDIVGIELRVGGPAERQSFVTARRFRVEEVAR